ncbi:MAG TPA: glycosyl transferase family 1, partial [Xanthobacteraceae bacterium]
MRIAYLVHNLADPAVAKRVRMLRAFDDEVVLFGFHRDDTVIKQVADVDAIDLGGTRDGGFVQRIAMVAKRCLRLPTWAKPLHDCDVIVARNLEMLALAAWARRFYAPSARLVYECLDIHRLMLSRHWAGTMLRRLEGF